MQTDISGMANDILISDTARVEFITFYNPQTVIDVASTRTPSEQALEPGPHRFWISASELCRGFGKRFRDFLASERGRELLKAFLAIPFEQGGMPGPADHSHMFRRGKTGFGNDAWICPRLVPHVVYWLSPELSIRLNHVMVEVLLGHQSSADGRAAIEQVRLTSTVYIMYVPSGMYRYFLPYFAVCMVSHVLFQKYGCLASQPSCIHFNRSFFAWGPSFLCNWRPRTLSLKWRISSWL